MSKNLAESQRLERWYPKGKRTFSRRAGRPTAHALRGNQVVFRATNNEVGMINRTGGNN